MTVRERAALWSRPLLFLGRNSITFLGAVLVTGSGVTMVGFWGLEVLQLRPVQPYAGIILFLILPAVFVVGLLLMPIGILWHRHRLRVNGELPDSFPAWDIRQPMLRRGAAFLAGATLLNVAILSTASYKGVEHMESAQFCGTSCHVMEPEYTAYVGAPHSRVACAECHVGSGASWFVRSKLSGTRQLVALARNTYSRPIPSPVKDLRPASETCAHCHWPQKLHGDKIVVRSKYQDDENNTRTVTVLALKIGGGSSPGGHGIHGRHLGAGERISYVATDDRRQEIPRVTYVDAAGKTVEYVSSEIKVTPEQLARAEDRNMDCVDCHNRPAHAFELPERAVDAAMSEGTISPTLPFVKKKAVELLRAEYPDREQAARSIPEGLAEFYKRTYPDVYARRRDLVETAGQRIAGIYHRNVFPAMKVGWGTYPNNIGHEDSPGCFRCHDESHKSADGRTITQDCTTCHTVLAMEEPNPKILTDLGIE